MPLTLLVLSPFCTAQLPDSPTPSASLASAPNLPPQYPADSPDPLTLKERFVLQTKLSFSVAAIVDPAFEAAITMADPPSHYPRDWADGGEAFGRNYGAELGRHVASGYTHFAAAYALREDPRYFRYNGTGYGKRALHAVLFTLVDRRDSGHKTLAVSNLIGATGGGFAGMLWEPDGFDDVTHAYQRTAVELGGYGSTNLLYEFSPELTKLLAKCRLGRFSKLMPTPPVDAPRAIPR
ncbi:MAG TPA: hypothetical protein VL346_01285 [Acidobacteriaceae bacterium]|nr:hypothetical protein [Acidobacteriaceae bacterium]